MPWQSLMQGYVRSTLPDTEPGCLLLLGGKELIFSEDLLWHARHHSLSEVLRDAHRSQLQRLGATDPDHPDYARHFQQATLYVCTLFRLGFYEGDLGAPLTLTFRPKI